MLSLLVKELVSTPKSITTKTSHQSTQIQCGSRESNSVKRNSLNESDCEKQQHDTEKRMFDGNNNWSSKAFSLMECLNESMSCFRVSTITAQVNELLEATFIVSNALPEVINLQSLSDFCKAVMRKILSHVKKQKLFFDLSSEAFRKLLGTFVHNLTVAKPLSHEYAKFALIALAGIHKTNVISLLYLSSRTSSEDVPLSKHFDNLLERAKKDEELYLENFVHTDDQQITSCLPSAFDANLLIKQYRFTFIA